MKLKINCIPRRNCSEIGKEKKEITLFELDDELFEEVKGICETKYVQCNSSTRKTCS